MPMPIPFGDAVLVLPIAIGVLPLRPRQTASELSEDESVFDSEAETSDAEDFAGVPAARARTGLMGRRKRGGRRARTGLYAGRKSIAAQGQSRVAARFAVVGFALGKS